MKNLKKVLAFLLVAMMVLSFSATAFADDPAPATSITVENATIGQTYKLYKIFDVEVDAAGTIVYSLNDLQIADVTAWMDIMLETGAQALLDITVTTQDVGARIPVLVKEYTDAQAAVDVMKNIVAKGGGTLIDTKVADSDTIVWNNLEPGYYYIESTLGAVVTTDNLTNASITVIDKNQLASGEKKIVLADGSLADTSTIDYGETVNWQITVQATNFVSTHRIQKYEIVDTMDSGFTTGSFVVDAVEIWSAKLENGKLVPDSKIQDLQRDDSITGAVKGKYEYRENENTYTIGWGTSTESFYPANCFIIVKCHGVSNAAGGDYINNVLIGYSNCPAPITDSVTSYTSQIVVNKFTGTGENKKALENVGFKLYKLVPGAEGAEPTKLYYSFANDVVSWVDHTSEDKTDVNGHITFEGLADGTYYLEESTPLPGYNKIDDIEVVVTNPQTDSKNPYEVSVDVENQAGAVLPSTGGIGTTIFYIVGGLLVIGAAVVLVAKKRVSE